MCYYKFRDITGERVRFLNKQQLATKIWESANKMRSKIEANEYKDYILGFIFYKYLSDYEIKTLKAAILFHTITYFQHGLKWVLILMFQT